MSQHATDLCTTIVRDTFGELASRIFGALCSYGRLPLHSIQAHTELRLSQIKHGLALLMQQNLISGSPKHDDITYYEANLSNAYLHLTFGRGLGAVESRLGSSAAALSLEIHLAGRCGAKDLFKASVSVEDEADENRAAQTNRVWDGMQRHGPYRSSFFTDLAALVRAQVVVVYHESHSRSNSDNWREAEQAAREKYALWGPLKPQDKLKVEEDIRHTLVDWRQGNADIRREVVRRISSNSLPANDHKRRLDPELAIEETERTKRRQLNSGNAHVTKRTDGHDDPPMTNLDDYILLVNYDKLHVLARNEVLASHAERAICQATASVYTKVLMNIEEKVVSLPMPTSESREDDVEEFVEAKVSTQEVLALLGSTAGLADSLAPADANLHDHDRTLPPKERKKSGYKVDEEQSDENMSNAESSDMETAEQDMNGDAPRANGVSAEWNGSSASHYHQNSRNIEDVRQHLLLLAEHPLHFLVHHPRTATTAESWSVPFGSLTTRLRLAAVMDTIASRYPSAALRLANLLHEKGKLDEKALSFQSLLNQKIMRSCLASMHSDGLLELQEVPRDNNRMPAKTIFLWFFDPRRAAARLLNETYKAMSRLLQRVSVERESFRGVLDKASRSDVVGREEELLTKGELSSLKTWKAKESRLFGELERLDDLVLLLQNE